MKHLLTPDGSDVITYKHVAQWVCSIPALCEWKSDGFQ